MKVKLANWNEKLDGLLGEKEMLITRGKKLIEENEELQKENMENKENMIKATEQIRFSNTKIRRRNLADLQLLRESEIFLARAEEGTEEPNPVRSERELMMKRSVKEVRTLMLKVIDWIVINQEKLDSTHHRISWLQDEVEELTDSVQETTYKASRRKLKQYTLARIREAKLGEERLKLMALNRSLRGKMKILYRKFLRSMMVIEIGSSVQSL